METLLAPILACFSYKILELRETLVTVLYSIIAPRESASLERNNDWITILTDKLNVSANLE